MSADLKTRTEREIVLASRAAYKQGVVDHLNGLTFSSIAFGDTRHVDNRAKVLYPLPKTTRPRVIKLSVAGAELSYRYVSGQLQYQDRGSWSPTRRGISDFSADDLRKLADLFANPNEDVESDC